MYKRQNDNSEEPAVTSVNERTVNTPLPAGISELVNEKPTTVVPPVDTVNPASPAAPPEAPDNDKPVTSNWKPATGPPKSYVTSKLPEASNAPKPKLASWHASSPLHTPHSSSTAEPPQSPAQSSTLPSQSHAPSAIPSPPHSPHSSTTASP